jgi:Caenorhabditis protein of unknown function, DUF268
MSKLARRIGGPLIRYFDHRFEEIKQQLRSQVAPDGSTVPLDQAVASQVTASVSMQLAGATAQVLNSTTSTAETVAGVAQSMDRRLDRFLRDQDNRDLRNSLELGRYRSDVVAFLNWTLSFEGPVAERSLLMNHPLTVLFDTDGPRLFEVNERIVEVPFVLNACGMLPIGSRVVDVGATESTLALSLASQGHLVYALDPRRYPFSHPNLTAVATEVDGWNPSEQVAMVIAVSAIEHFGLGHYVAAGDAERGADADRRALDRFREWLLPGGTVVLTLPTGEATTDEFQRVYDEARLKRLIDGWTVVRQECAVRVSDTVWERVPALDEHRRGVVMLVLE